MGRLFGAVLTMGIAGLVLSGCATDSSGASVDASAPNATQSATQSASSGPDASLASFKDGVLRTSDVEISITKHKVIAVGAKGNEYGDKPVLAFYYDIKNVSGDDLTPLNWIILFKAYQDNNPNSLNELEVGSLPDDRFLDTQSEKIKQGGTVKNAVAYELDDLKTPVDLVASDDLGSSEIGRASFDVK